MEDPNVNEGVWDTIKGWFGGGKKADAGDSQPKTPEDAGIDTGIKVSELLTPTDVAGAVTAGVIAYIRNKARTKQEDTPEGGSLDDVKDEFSQFKNAGQVKKVGTDYVATDSSGQPIAVYKPFKGGGMAKFNISNGKISDGSYFSPNGQEVPLDSSYIDRSQGNLDKFIRWSDTQQQSLADKGIIASPMNTTLQQMQADDKALFAAASKVRVGDSITVQEPDGDVFAVGKLKDGTLWKAPVVKDPDFNDYDFGQAVTQDGKPIQVSGFLQQKSEKLAEMGNTFHITQGGKLAMKPDTPLFSIANPPDVNDMSDAANRFWLTHPKIAKDHGITVSNVVKSGNGIHGEISRVPPGIKNDMMASAKSIQQAMAARQAETDRLRAAYDAAKANFEKRF